MREPSLAFAVSILALCIAPVLCGRSDEDAPRGDIVVSPRGADSNAGTQAARLRSLKQTLLSAQSGQNIRLESGTYDEQSGETWSYGVPAGCIASGELDLGTATEAGNNAITGRDGVASAFGIYVDVGAGAVTSSATSFDGVVPPVGIVQATDAEIAQPGEYLITPAQSMQFFDAP